MARLVAFIFLLMGLVSGWCALAPFPIIVIRDHPIVAESAHADGIVETNETITCAISLQNLGDLYAPNVSAELIASDGITPVTGEQVYGTMLISNAPVTQNFSFVVAGPVPRVAVATLVIKSNGKEIGRDVFDVPVGDSVYTFSSLNFIDLPANRVTGQGIASEYPSSIGVSNLVGTITALRVTLHNLTHVFSEDINAVLLGPGGSNVMLISDCGGFYAVSNINLTLDSRAANYLPTIGNIPSGTYACTDFNYPNSMPAPSPNPDVSPQMNIFRRAVPNATWQLFLYDYSPEDVGVLAGGWSLTIFVQKPPSLAVRDNGDGRIVLTLNNSGNRTFLLDYSTNAHDWTTLGQFPASSNSVSVLDFHDKAHRFYRARRTTP